MKRAVTQIPSQTEGSRAKALRRGGAHSAARHMVHCPLSSATLGVLTTLLTVTLRLRAAQQAKEPDSQPQLRWMGGMGLHHPAHRLQG